MRMKLLFTAVFAALSLTFLGGCVRPTMTFNDKTYAVLTEKEEKALVERSRILLSRPSKALTVDDVAVVQHTEPKVEVKYTGDCTGILKIIWTGPEKIIISTFDGELLTSNVGWMLETEKRLPEILRFSPPPISEQK